MARLFVALWPDEPAREALSVRAAEIAGECGGRPVSATKLHLTLVFLGDVDMGRVSELIESIGGLAASSFVVGLDCVGWFRRSGVTWAGCRQVPAQLVSLQSELERRVRKGGFGRDERPFSPHLTLVRRARGPVRPREIEAISWRANSFTLVESPRDGRDYRIVAEWPLGNG